MSLSYGHRILNGTKIFMTKEKKQAINLLSDKKQEEMLRAE